MGKRKKRLSVKKPKQAKGKRTRSDEATVSPGSDSLEPEADKTVTFFDRSGKTSHAYCDEPATSEEEINDVERSGARNQRVDSV